MPNIWNTIGRSADYDAEQAQRNAWFSKIEPRDNWKNPINAWISIGDFHHCNQAALWFTGHRLTIAEQRGDKMRVTAPGYYATIGA